MIAAIPDQAVQRPIARLCAGPLKAAMIIARLDGTSSAPGGTLQRRGR